MPPSSSLLVELLSVVLLLSNFCNVGAFYFLASPQRRCFNIEQPRDTPMVFAYELLDTEPVLLILAYGQGSIEELKIKELTVEKGAGHIDFVADNDGAYSVCVELKDKAALTTSRFKLAINYGYDSEYYEKLSTEQHFDQINMEVHRLNDQMTMILNEADFQKHKEIQYHLQTEKMNSAALWWPMVQIGILVATGILQVQNLKMFFKRHKLI